MSEPESSGRTRGRPNLRQLFDSLQPSDVPRPKTVTNGLGDLFVYVPAGSFEMGSPAEQIGYRTNEGPVHEVVLTKPFYLAAHLTTQRSYQAVVGRNPAFFHPERGGTPDHPVESVSWDDAVRYCELLSARPEERSASRRYRLPTEAEWEYACRAGTTTATPHGDTLTADHAAFGTATTTPVGQYPSNPFGLFDLIGNVWEWCADWYDERYYQASPVRDPAGPAEGPYRITRGGSWKNQGPTCRSAYRNALAPHQKNAATGFRVVLEVG